MPSITTLERAANRICDRMNLPHVTVVGSNKLRRKGYIGMFKTPNHIFLARKDMRTVCHELAHYVDWSERHEANAHDAHFTSVVHRVQAAHNAHT